MKKRIGKMPKGQIVIKYMLTFFILTGYSQNTLIGTYRVNVDNGGLGIKTYQLYENGIFEFLQGERFFYGKGHYTFKNDSLILKYDLSEAKIKSYQRQRIFRNSSDSIQVIVTVFDMDKNSLPRSNVFHTDSHYGEIADKNGTVNLNFKKGTGTIKITVSELNYGEYSFKVDTDYNYEVDVFLRKLPHSVAIKNEVQRFKVLEHTDKALILLDESGNKIVWEKRE